MSAILPDKQSPFNRHVWLTISLLVTLAITFTIYVQSEHKSDLAAEMRYKSFLLADELRQSSDDLTRMVRTYVVTGDPVYKKYYQDILDIRNGKKQRPVGYQNIYWDFVLANKELPHPGSGQAVALLDLMRQVGFTEEEFSKLAEAKANSDGLTVREFEAMKLIDSTGPEAVGNRAKARLMMHDAKYHQAKAAIMKPIDEFFELMDKRTSDAVQAARTRATNFRVVFIVLGLSLMVLLLRTNKILHKIMGGSVDEVYAHITKIGHGDFSSTILVTADMKNSVLGWLAETQANLNGIDSERRRAGEEMQRSEEKFRVLYDSTSDAVMLLDEKGFFDCNKATLTMFGCATREEFYHKHPAVLSPPQQPCGTDSMVLANNMISTAVEKGSNHFEWVHKRDDTGDTFPADVLLNAMELDGKKVIQAVVRDITEARRVGAYREMSRKVFEILNEPGGTHNSIQRVLAELKILTGCDAVGICLQEGKDFPYFCQEGFSDASLLTENTLLKGTVDGAICHYKDGSLCLEGACGLVISGKTDPANKLFTRGGSFWTNDSFAHLDIPIGDDPRHNPRNQCMHHGYASIALIPIRRKDRVVGLIQLNDWRKGLFNIDIIELMEGVASNIGEALSRKQVEEALRESEKRYKNFVENSLSGVYVVQDGCFAFVNSNVAAFMGYKPEEIIGRPSDNFFHPEDREKIRGNAKKMLSGEELLPYEYRIVSKSGQLRWVMQTVSPIIFNGRQAILGNCIDVTDKRQREVQNLHSQKLESVGQLAAGIAHEINTPIQFIGDNISFMKGAFQDILSLSTLLKPVKSADLSDPEVAKDLLSRIHNKEEEIDIEYLRKEIPLAIQQSLDGLQRVSKIVLAMREFSHPGGADKTNMDINKAIESTIILSRNEWKYQADLTTDLAPDLPTVQGYPADFNQVILNLIVNAAQALQEKAGTGNAEKGRIEISTRQDGNEVEICIRDTGRGIPPEVQSRIFDPFFTTKEVGKGTGQGLTIAHNIIVSKHGGKIHFETSIGEGTAFYIRLPIIKE
jgi:PAS domain S-box-containing protein